MSEVTEGAGVGSPVRVKNHATNGRVVYFFPDCSSWPNEPLVIQSAGSAYQDLWDLELDTYEEVGLALN